MFLQIETGSELEPESHVHFGGGRKAFGLRADSRVGRTRLRCDGDSYDDHDDHDAASCQWDGRVGSDDDHDGHHYDRVNSGATDNVCDGTGTCG